MTGLLGSVYVLLGGRGSHVKKNAVQTHTDLVVCRAVSASTRRSVTTSEALVCANQVITASPATRDAQWDFMVTNVRGFASVVWNRSVTMSVAGAIVPWVTGVSSVIRGA